MLPARKLAGSSDSDSRKVLQYEVPQYESPGIPKSCSTLASVLYEMLRSDAVQARRALSSDKLRSNIERLVSLQKRFVVLLACGLFAVALLARADAPAPNAQELGTMESILQNCGPIDPAAAAKLQEKVKQLVQGASEQVLAKVESDEYKQAYASITDVVTAAPNPAAACSGSPTDNK